MATVSAATTISSTTVSSKALSLPSGTSPGHLVVIALALDLVTGGTYTFTGWTQIGAQQVNTTDGESYTYWKRKLDGSEGATATVSWTGGASTVAAVAIAFSGRNTGFAHTLTVTTQNTAQASPISVSLTGVTPPAGADVVAFIQTDNASGSTASYSFSQITGWANRATANSNGFDSVNGQTLDNSSGAATGSLASTVTLTAGAGSAGWLGVVISLPAAVGATWIPRIAGPGAKPGNFNRFPTRRGYSVATVQNLTQTINVTVGLSQARVLQVGLIRATTVTLSQVPVKQVGWIRALTLTLSQAPTKALGVVRSITVGLSQSPVKLVGLIRGATVGLSLAFSEGLLFTRSFSYTVGLSLATSLGLILGRTFGFTLGLSQATVKAVSLAKSYTVGLSQTPTRAVALIRAITVGLSQATTKQLSIAKSYTVSLSQTVLDAATLRKAFTYTVTLSQALTTQVIPFSTATGKALIKRFYGYIRRGH